MAVAQWLERRSRHGKVSGSNPGRSGGRIFFSVQGQLSVLTFYFGILYEVESEAGVPKTRAIRDCVVCSEAL